VIRRLTLIGLTALVATGVGAVGPGRAGAAARPGAACPAGSDGVTVVVDFGTLAGGVQIRCVAGEVTSGLDALTEAGFTHQGTQRFPGLLCRIDGKPAEDPCVNAPPGDRYWAYWTASEPGGAWVYSDLGAGNRKPPPGSVEGWAFSDGCTRAPQGPACSEPADPTTTRPSPTTTRPATGGPDPGVSPPTSAGAGPTTSSAEPTEDTTTTTTSTPVVAAGGTAPEPGDEGDEQALAPSDPAGGRGGGSPIGALVGIGMAGSLAGVALVTARRRRRVEEEPA
jgi:hypothetical protein